MNISCSHKYLHLKQLTMQNITSVLPLTVFLTSESSGDYFNPYLLPKTLTIYFLILLRTLL